MTNPSLFKCTCGLESVGNPDTRLRCPRCGREFLDGTDVTPGRLLEQIQKRARGAGEGISEAEAIALLNDQFWSDIMSHRPLTEDYTRAQIDDALRNWLESD
jgi:hypothetical protein